MEDKNIVYLSTNGLERGFIQSKRNMTRRHKELAKEISSYIYFSYLTNGVTFLHNLWGLDVSYLPDIPFELLDNGYTTDCKLGVIFVTWCIVKLDCYVNLFSACNILIVANYISHMGIKMISWSW